MNPIATIVVSLILPLIAMIIVTAIVSARVRHAPATSTWKATREGVLFVVSSRRWQRVLIRSIGIMMIVVGGFTVLAAVADTGGDSSAPMGITGSIITVVGVVMVWLAHGMARLRLEVASDTVWAFPLAGAPRQVALREVTELAPVASNNYGGIVARSETRRLFYATRIMLGYPQLIDHLRERRPDLVIPDASWPLQRPAA